MNGSTNADAREPAGLFACFYGDDFTGSTDALFQFHRFGLRSTLLVRPLDEASVRAAAMRYDVIGVAGVARSLPSAAIDAELRPIFALFQRLNPQLVQYKICSTFDSSPDTGSFAPAVALAREVFGAVALPVLPAQPEFGRYTFFANHFARAGTQSYRLDRHPTMACHPSTPVDEADLRLFLGRQVTGAIGNFDLITLRTGLDATLLAHLKQLRAAQPAAIIFDAIENVDVIRIARLLRRAAWPALVDNGVAPPRQPIVALGSGGLSYGFAAAETELSPRQPAPQRLAPVEKLLVVSGSCAPQTAAQIEWALAHGWRGVRIDPAIWFAASLRERDALVRKAAAQVIAELDASERGAVVYSALGPAGRGQSVDGDSNGTEFASVLGTGLGQIVRQVFEATGLRRAIVAGGDTSGYATRALGAESLEIIVPLVPAGAVCRLSSRSAPELDGAELMLKGGQVGPRELFEFVRTAETSVGVER